MNIRIVTLLILLLISSLLTVACSDKQRVTKAPETVESLKSLATDYGFTLFNLSIDTQETKQAIVVDFETKSDATRAKYENTIDGKNSYGNKALKKLDPIFSELAINADMDAEDLIKEIAKAFEMSDYKSLQIGIQFKGHDKKEFMLTK